MAPAIQVVSQQNPAFSFDALATWNDAALISWVMQNPTRKDQVVNVLLDRHRPWIVQRCRFHLSNAQDAQDVTQQVAVRVYKKLLQLKDPSGFKAWLCRIIDNCCHTYAVQRARYVTNLEEGIEDGSEVLPVNTAGPSQLKNMEEIEAVAYIFSLMPAAATEVLKLRFYEDYSLEQIAQRLSIKLSAAKARLYRALSQFKALYWELVIH